MVSIIGKKPQFLLIKHYIEDRISSGILAVGDLVPSENQLAERFSVSRMTARRALKELADEGSLSRSPGLGSFVTKPSMQPSVIIKDAIATAQASNGYQCKVLDVSSFRTNNALAQQMHIASDRYIFKGVFLHFDRNKPIQYQEILVNSVLVPAFIKQNFNKITADAYLKWILPATSTDYNISAAVANEDQKHYLELLEEDNACLKIVKRHWLDGVLVSNSVAVHAGQQYQLVADVSDAQK
ncbi:MAG: GntR family transcriptional regulator [Porticoccaceae bacterium]|nr:GntR family transcriptional regulator [Porticoccaceae bacterium]MDG1475021.1 GntR family transcriptional regulator [Porticoccaceae bacterium]